MARLAGADDTASEVQGHLDESFGPPRASVDKDGELNGDDSGIPEYVSDHSTDV